MPDTRIGRGRGLILLHPDYTVGPGVAPDLLTQKFRGETLGARGLGVAPLPPVGNCTPP